MKKIVSTVLVAMLVLSLAARGSSDQTEEDGIVLKIASFRVGTHNAAAAEARYIEEFEAYYNGVDREKITIELEQMPSDAEYYNQMKIRASSGTLPAIFEGNAGVLELAIENDLAVDMAKFIEADAQYASELGAAAIASGTWEDGGVYNISYGLQAIGYFYNKEMFDAAGIQPARTWDEWMSNLEALKRSGIRTPISTMTGENAWTTNLILASMVGTDGEAGNTFMNTKYVETYNTPEFVNAVEKIQIILQEYSPADAIGSDYATAANHFLNEQTAIICNGPWMTPDFSNPDKAADGFAAKVGVALYPEGGAISQFERGYSIAKSTPEIEEAAFKFIQFKTNAYGQQIHLEEAGVLPLTSAVEMSDEFKTNNPLVVEFVEKLDGLTYQYQTIDVISYPNALATLTTIYPQLAEGSMSAREFAIALDEAAAKDPTYGR